MSIFKPGAKLRGEVQELTKQVGQLKTQNERLVHEFVLMKGEADKKYVGNEYKDYKTAVKAISEKYVGTADWGVLQTRNIIDLRSAFILGEGIRVSHTTKTRAEAEQELGFAKDFVRFNNLDGQLDQQMAKEAEIEGKIAIKLTLEDLKEKPYNKWTSMVSTRYLSWQLLDYKIEADPVDYLLYKKLTWPKKTVGTKEIPLGDLEPSRFVYAKFGGRLNEPNEAQPKIMACLSMVDRLDKALRDLREIMHYFASPTPHFKVASKEEGVALDEYLRSINWKIGHFVVTTAEFSIVSADVRGAETLVSEIELAVKMISGATGIPIHYLGLLDLLKNRATGENVRELIMAATTSERQTWIGVYEEVFTKAMEMWNRNNASQKSEDAQLDPTRVKVDIPQITQEHWDRVEKVLIPAATGGIISKEYVAEQIPGIDIEAESERRKTREAAEAARAKDEMKALKEDINREGGLHA